MLFSKYLEAVFRPVFVLTGIITLIDGFLCGFIVAGVNLGDSLRWSRSSCTHQLCRSWNALHL